MKTARITITIDRRLLAQVDRFAKRHSQSSRSRAIEAILRESLRRRTADRKRFLREVVKLDPAEEKRFAEEFWRV
jgi:metal-responsive CopG/Arc/MetJ family transcriptional regulator